MSSDACPNTSGIFTLTPLQSRSVSFSRREPPRDTASTLRRFSSVLATVGGGGHRPPIHRGSEAYGSPHTYHRFASLPPNHNDTDTDAAKQQQSFLKERACDLLARLTVGSATHAMDIRSLLLAHQTSHADALAALLDVVDRPDTNWKSVAVGLLSELCRWCCGGSDNSSVTILTKPSSHSTTEDSVFSLDPRGTHGSIPDRCTDTFIRSSDALVALAPVMHDLQLSMESINSRTPPLHSTNVTVGDDPGDGTLSINQHVLLSLLGSGSEGEVYLAMDTKVNQLRAVKVVKRPKCSSDADATTTTSDSPKGGGGPIGLLRRHQRRTQLEREIAIMKRCHHRNIPALFEVIDDPSHDEMYLVMQYIENGPIARLQADGTVSKTFTALALADITVQLCCALKYLHRHGIYHRDIKPDNILINSNGTVFLADFGSADVVTKEAPLFSDHVCDTKGTLAFLPPELFTDEAPPSVPGSTIDLWALGVTLYVLYYGRIPWSSSKARSLTEEIRQCHIAFVPRANDSSSLDAPPGSLEHTAIHSSTSNSREENANPPPLPIDSAQQQWEDTLRLMLSRQPSERPTLHKLIERCQQIIDSGSSGDCDELVLVVQQHNTHQA